jgi:hypothetical protein
LADKHYNGFSSQYSFQHPLELAKFLDKILWPLQHY